MDLFLSICVIFVGSLIGAFSGLVIATVLDKKRSDKDAWKK